MEAYAELLFYGPFALILLLMFYKLYKIISVKRKRSKFKIIQGEKKDRGPYGKTR